MGAAFGFLAVAVGLFYASPAAILTGAALVAAMGLATDVGRLRSRTPLLNSPRRAVAGGAWALLTGATLVGIGVLAERPAGRADARVFVPGLSRYVQPSSGPGSFPLPPLLLSAPTTPEPSPAPTAAPTPAPVTAPAPAPVTATEAPQPTAAPPAATAAPTTSAASRSTASPTPRPTPIVTPTPIVRPTPIVTPRPTKIVTPSPTARSGALYTTVAAAIDSAATVLP